MVDPSGLAALVSQLSADSLRAGRLALTALSVLLDEQEVVEVLVQGRFRHEAAVCALTDRRVLVVNDREWRPDLWEAALHRDLVVQGWEDDSTASLTFVAEGVEVTVDAIFDRPLAHEFARRLRERVAEMSG